MDRAEECVCCHEIPQVVNKNMDVFETDKLETKPDSITDNPGFEDILDLCLAITDRLGGLGSRTMFCSMSGSSSTSVIPEAVADKLGTSSVYTLMRW